MISKDSCSSSFWEFTIFVVEIFSGGDVVKKSPILFWGDKAWRKDDSVEGYIIFPHELVVFDWGVNPPFLVVFVQQISCDWDVTNGSIEPNIKDFFLKVL